MTKPTQMTRTSEDPSAMLRRMVADDIGTPRLELIELRVAMESQKAAFAKREAELIANVQKSVAALEALRAEVVAIRAKYEPAPAAVADNDEDDDDID